MEMTLQNNAKVSLRTRSKLWGAALCIAFFVAYGFVAGFIDYSAFSVENLVILFIICPYLSISFSIVLLGAVYGVVVAFKFAWEHISIWSLLMIFIVLAIGMSIGGILLTIMLIKDIVSYIKLKRSIKIKKARKTLEEKLKSIALIVIPMIVSLAVGLCLGYVVNIGVDNAINKLRYSKEDQALLEVYDIYKTSGGYGIRAKGETLSGVLALPETFNDKPIVEIGEYAFKGCDKLEEIIMPNTIETIGAQAFRDCSGLKKINLSTSLYSIGNKAFANCESLTELKFPDSLIEISGNSFGRSLENCSSLKTVYIGKGFTTFPSSIFDECDALENIYMPNTVQVIEERAFIGPNNIKNIYYGGTIEEWKKIEIEHNAMWDNTEIIVHCSDGELELVDFYK